MELNGLKLKAILIEKCWSINNLARSAKVSPTTLNKILNKGCVSNTATIGKIAKALGVNPKEIIKE